MFLTAIYIHPRWAVAVLHSKRGPISWLLIVRSTGPTFPGTVQRISPMAGLPSGNPLHQGAAPWWRGPAILTMHLACQATESQARTDSGKVPGWGWET